MNHPAIKHAEHSCYACPDQWEGELINGKQFYYRFRWGVAELGVGDTMEEAVSVSNHHRMKVSDDLDGLWEDETLRDQTFTELLSEIMFS